MKALPGMLRSLAFVLAACAGTAEGRGADLVIAMPNWPSGQATAYLLGAAISREFGLEAKVVELGALNAFSGMERGTVDIQPEVWSPNLDAAIRKYVEDKKVAVLGDHIVKAWQGLCATPAAARQIKSVDDLRDPAKTAALDTDGDGRGEMWIGAATWLSTGIEKVRAASYGYADNLALVEAEEEVAMAAVDAAVATDRPMVFACYAPHYVFDLHGVTRLAEPAHDASKWKIAAASDPGWIAQSSAPVAWPAAHFSLAYTVSFGKKHPDIARFLDHVDLSTEEVSRMTYALEVEHQQPQVFASAWIENQAERVHGWAAP